MKKKYCFHKDLIIPIIALIIGSYFFFASQKIAKSSDDFPKVFSSLVIILAVINLIDAIKANIKGLNLLRSGQDAQGMISFTDLKIPIISIGIILAYVLSINFIGYFVSSVIFMPLMMLLLKYRNWKVIVIVTIIMTIFVYIIFVRFLNVRMPNALLF